MAGLINGIPELVRSAYKDPVLGVDVLAEAVRERLQAGDAGSARPLALACLGLLYSHQLLRADVSDVVLWLLDDPELGGSDGVLVRLESFASRTGDAQTLARIRAKRVNP
jgi:hypothetical protein